MPYGTLLTARTRCDCLINASIDGLLRRNDTAIPAGPEDEFGQFADLNGFRIPKIKDLIQSALIE